MGRPPKPIMEKNRDPRKSQIDEIEALAREMRISYGQFKALQYAKQVKVEIPKELSNAKKIL